MTLALTKPQERVWRYIKSCERSPTYDEMLRDLGYRSKAPVNNIVRILKEKGYVDYRPWKARTLVALDPKVDLSSFTTEALRAEIIRRQFA